MNDIEKASLAITVAGTLLEANKLLLAVKTVKYMYQSDLPDAKHFVDTLRNLKEKS